jgi:8-oxo-dGTP pyrophosphatase MutT (NUDIX family)
MPADNTKSTLPNPVRLKVYADPDYTKVTGAGTIMREADGRIWMIQPSNGFGGKTFAIPKGRIEPGHSLNHTAVKELYEETGLGHEITDYLGSFANSTGGRNAVFEGKRIGGHPEQMGWETQGLTLIKPQDALAKMNPKDPDYAILKAFADKHAPAVQTGEIKLGIGNAGPQDFGDGWNKIGNKPGGSNPGGVYTDPSTGEKALFKHPPTIEHAKDEELASSIYNIAGIPVAPVKAGAFQGKPTAKVRWVNDLKPVTLEEMAKDSKLRQGFGIDALLANWDVVGLTDDNIMRNAAGELQRIDLGGTLRWRAQGGPKGDKWGADPGEIKTFMNPSFNPKTSKLYANLTLEEATGALKHVTAVSPDAIRGLVRRAYGSGKDADDMILNLIERRQKILNMGPQGLMDATRVGPSMMPPKL